MCLCPGVYVSVFMFGCVCVCFCPGVCVAVPVINFVAREFSGTHSGFIVGSGFSYASLGKWLPMFRREQRALHVLSEGPKPLTQ